MSNLQSNKENGIKAENYFISKLNKLGIPYNFIDGWYDFEVLDQWIEIKSCRLSIKHKYKNKRRRYEEQYRIGRFDFTEKENRKAQYKNNIWICFIIRHGSDFLMMGLCRAKELKKRRYISIHKLRDLNLISLEQWIENYN